VFWWNFNVIAATAAAGAAEEEEEKEGGGRDIDVICIVGREDRQRIRPLRKQGTSNIIQVLIECFYILFPIYYLIDYTTSKTVHVFHDISPEFNKRSTLGVKVSLVKHKLPTLREHMNSSTVLLGFALFDLSFYM
jgi:hypothetical protein